MTILPAGTQTAAHDPTPEEKLQAMIERQQAAFEARTGSITPGNNFANIINGSPKLKEMLVQAVKEGKLDGFGFAGNDWGTYSYRPGDKTILMPMEKVAVANNDPTWMNEATYSLAHEARHALGRDKTLALQETTQTEIEKQFVQYRFAEPGKSNRLVPHDYTDELKRYIAGERDSESRAEIAGFNATISALQKKGGVKSLAELYEAAPSQMSVVVQRTGEGPDATYALRKGYTLSADFTMAETPENVATMGKHFFDTPATTARLGKHGNQDYRNHYTADMLNYMISMEAPFRAKIEAKGDTVPAVHLNMKALGLDEKQLEPYLNLPNGKPFVYYDTSTGVPVKKTFDPVVEKTQDKPAKPTDPGKVEPGKPELGKPDPGKTGKPGKGPDADGYGADGVGTGAVGMVDPVERLDGRRRTDFDTIAATVSRDGRWDGEATRNIAGALLREVDRDPSVRQVDRVLIAEPGAGGPRVFAMYAPNQDREPYFHASVDATIAARQPVAQSLGEMAAQRNPAQMGQSVQQDLSEPARGPRMG